MQRIELTPAQVAEIVTKHFMRNPDGTTKEGQGVVSFALTATVEKERGVLFNKITKATANLLYVSVEF